MNDQDIESQYTLRQAVEGAQGKLLLTAGAILRRCPPDDAGDLGRAAAEQLRKAAVVLGDALNRDTGPGAVAVRDLRFLRVLLAGLLGKEGTDFSIQDAGHELGRLVHTLQQRLRRAEAALDRLIPIARNLTREIAIIDRGGPLSKIP